MSLLSKVTDPKDGLREYAIAKRKRAAREAGPTASIRAAEHFFSSIPIPPGTIVSGYFPVRDEFDVMPLMGRLSRAAFQCCLPKVQEKNKPLSFREWYPGMNLITGCLDILEPDSDSRVLVPSILIVPLLAFDSEGFRLGYGGGYYDRTINILRKESSDILAVGIAYTEQQVEQVPHNSFDAQLDWVVTERGAMPIKSLREKSSA